MSKKLELKDLSVNVHKKITVDVRKRLVEIIENEFQEQRARFQEQEQQAKTKIIEEHKKLTAWDKKKKELDKLDAKIEALKIMYDTKEEEMKTETGLDRNASLCNQWNEKNTKAKEKAIELRRKLEKAINRTSASNIKQKVIARMTMADTIGEACVILQSVMGNDIIPSLTITDLQPKQIEGSVS